MYSPPAVCLLYRSSAAVYIPYGMLLLSLLSVSAESDGKRGRQHLIFDGGDLSTFCCWRRVISREKTHEAEKSHHTQTELYKSTYILWLG